MNPIYIGTILLEKNRWAKGKIPSYRVSEWLPRFLSDGFAGMELWENHAAMAAEDEIAALECRSFPVAIYNSYCDFTHAGADGRSKAATLATRLHAEGVKFNIGNDATKQPEYVANAIAWGRELPANTRLLCECHPGTLMDDPERAKEVYSIWTAALPGRFQAIVHPFTTPRDVLRRWFACVGPLITHAHVQLRDEAGACRGLRYNKSLVKDTLRMMHDAGFSGSFTLEFTEGTSKPGENAADLYKAALDDLALLREYLAALG